MTLCMQHRAYLKLLRTAMEVLTTSALSYYSQSNDWKLATKLTALSAATAHDEKQSLEEKAALAWLVQDLSSAFQSVLQCTLPAPSISDPVADMDKILSTVKHNARTGLSGEQFGQLNSNMLISFVKRLLVECLDELEICGVHSFGEYANDIQQASLPFSVILFGSLSKYEACPYSDIELLIVTGSGGAESKTEAKQADLHASLVALMQLFQLKVAGFGESTDKDREDSPDGISRQGFSFDAKIGLAVATGETTPYLDELFKFTICW